MRQTYIFLTFDKGCQRIPGDLVCTNEVCVAEQLEEDRKDRAAASEAALARALESGLIVPDDTPEGERYSQPD